MRVDVRRIFAAAILTALAVGGAALASCSPASQQKIQQANAEVMAKVNGYCDARQKTIEALGEAGAPQ